jgi:hypothetical protein
MDDVARLDISFQMLSAHWNYYNIRRKSKGELMIDCRAIQNFNNAVLLPTNVRTTKLLLERQTETPSLTF